MLSYSCRHWPDWWLPRSVISTIIPYNSFLSYVLLLVPLLVVTLITWFWTWFLLSFVTISSSVSTLWTCMLLLSTVVFSCIIGFFWVTALSWWVSSFTWSWTGRALTWHVLVKRFEFVAYRYHIFHVNTLWLEVTPKLFGLHGEHFFSPWAHCIWSHLPLDFMYVCHSIIISKFWLVLKLRSTTHRTWISIIVIVLRPSSSITTSVWIFLVIHL